jgi:hypothetical protein
VVEQGLNVIQAKEIDKFGKGGGLIDRELVREFPLRPKSASRNAA